MQSVAIIGAGLAGVEAALVLASRGVHVTLYEARPFYKTPAHTTDHPAELVCSNSFKSNLLPSAHGLLKEELRFLGSPLMKIAEIAAVPAGSALAVDREHFSFLVAKHIEEHPRITFKREEITEPPQGYISTIIAAGPLVSDRLAQWMIETLGTSKLHFYDAIAPIIEFDSIDTEIAFFASRWDKGDADYLNCPFTEEEFRRFYDALMEADRVCSRSFEQERFFEACLPIEVLAGRGYQSLAFGPLKPVGLHDPRTGKRPFAVCQLRKENTAGESYNMVGFQTRLTIPEQKRVLRLIPGLANAQFLRYGSIHRNTYLDSPQLLSKKLSFRDNPSLFLAGQLCGNEGYTESIATGHLAALFIAHEISGKPLAPPPIQTALGSLLRHVTESEEQPFTPTNIHFGLIPPLEQATKRKIGKKEKKQLLCDRALQRLHDWNATAGS